MSCLQPSTLIKGTTAKMWQAGVASVTICFPSITKALFRSQTILVKNITLNIWTYV